MKSGFMVALLLFATCCFAQRGDRDSSVGGARDGAIERSQDSENPELKAELKKLSKELKIGTSKLRKEFEASAKTYAAEAKTTQVHALGTEAVSPAPTYLSPEQFSKAKRASVTQKLPLDQIVAESAKQNGNVDAAITAVQGRQPTATPHP
jgi:hypothetical protein